jgi:hypothetical protein
MYKISDIAVIFLVTVERTLLHPLCHWSNIEACTAALLSASQRAVFGC